MVDLKVEFVKEKILNNKQNCETSKFINNLIQKAYIEKSDEYQEFFKSLEVLNQNKIKELLIDDFKDKISVQKIEIKMIELINQEHILTKSKPNYIWNLMFKLISAPYIYLKEKEVNIIECINEQTGIKETINSSGYFIQELNN